MLRILSIVAAALLLGPPSGATWITEGTTAAVAVANAFPAEHGVVSDAPTPGLPAAGQAASLSLGEPLAPRLDHALGYSAICRESDPVLECALSDALPLGSERRPAPATGPLLGDGRLP